MVAVAETVRAPRKRRLPAAGTLSFLGRLFRDKPLGAFGFVICVIFLFCGVFADVLAPYGYNQISPINRLKPPSEKFWLGTDNLGRDMLSRCLYGAQLSVIIGLSAAALATVVSIFIGIVSGYLGGKFDMIMQRFVDAWMSFPDLIILIVVVSVVGPGMGPVIVLARACSTASAAVASSAAPCCRCARTPTSTPRNRPAPRCRAFSGSTSCPTSWRR